MKHIISFVCVIVVGFAVALCAQELATLMQRVVLNGDGTVKSVQAKACSKVVLPDHNNNEYLQSEWDAFGITNEVPYIVKDGSVWRNMTAAEQAVVNSNLQGRLVSEVVADATDDAIIRTIAEAVRLNAKTYNEVKAILHGQVDPKKAKAKKTK